MPAAPGVDAVIIGGGFAGLYATHRLRNVLGLEVQSFEAGSGPGGTWYWNRYPGARCDFESLWYSYSFDEDLQREWRWSERFAAQPEILSYLEHVADRFDLRRSYEFDTRVTSVVWNESDQFWTVGTDTGRTVTARFVVAGSGCLSEAKADEFAGLEDFRGEILRTSAWPHEGVDLSGKRVAVIGTGSTGIQVIPEVARVAEQLTVFQRTANFASPLGNRPMLDKELDETIANYPKLRAASRLNFIGAPYPQAQPSALLVDEETRRQVYAQHYDGGAFRMVVSTFSDVLFNKQANDTVADYIRDRIRTRVNDPKVAEALCPGDDHPYATKRAAFETNYYEAFNRDNVTLVDLRATPFETVTPAGLRTTAGDHEFDVLVLATGFDALTGPLLAMNVVGRDGVPLKEVWSDGPLTYLGIAVPGFPNLFTITGPQSPAVSYNMPLAIEDHVDFTANAISTVRERGAVVFEATDDAAQRWKDMVVGISENTLLPLAKSSWYLGANVPGKPRTPLLFIGGAPLYRAICADVEASGYGGFTIGGSATPTPPTIDLDPAVAIVLGAMISQDPRPFETLTLPEQRATTEGLRALQLPPRETVRAIATSYPAAEGDLPVRVYVPENRGTDLPVVVFFHPGGWITGSIDVSEEPCRALADDLGAVVVTPSYRLAPEHPFPAATDDTVAAVRWAAEHARDYGGDPERIVVMGESAGGNLATVAAHRLRDEGGPALAAQVLLYPPIDPDADTPSHRRYAYGPPLSTAAFGQMWTQYLKDPAAKESPLAVPSKVASLQGLPPALVVTMEVDPNRDEAEAYAGQLAAAGVPTEVVRISGLVHASLNMSAYVPRSGEILKTVVAFLRTTLGLGDQPGEPAVRGGLPVASGDVVGSGAGQGIGSPGANRP
ncbi:alpha/beta hydrolase fold domain-containing protein [Streptomyces canus]|uniref:alpha/beta hydrolase fold domain-containing protein n=1 Tax=Streptomyces canus TaxID=58343 RepID=UPI00371EEECE